MSAIENDEFTITVRNIADALNSTETSVWRWLKKPFRVPYRRKSTPQNLTGRVHHIRLTDLISRLRMTRRGGLSEEEIAAFVHLDAERRHHLTNTGV